MAEATIESIASEPTPDGLRRKFNISYLTDRDLTVKRTPEGVLISLDGEGDRCDVLTPDQARHVANLLIDAAHAVDAERLNR